MMQKIVLLIARLHFPEGLAPGAGGDYNFLKLSRNGSNQLVLRGSAFAGVLRHAYSCLSENSSSRGDGSLFFGESIGYGEQHQSCIKVDDCILDTGKSQTALRNHHLRNRHTRAVVDGGLFTLESCPPGTQTNACIWIAPLPEHSPEEITQFINDVVLLLGSGLKVGGSSARGVGRIELAGKVQQKEFDLTDLNQHAAYLDTLRQVRQYGPAAINGLSDAAVPSFTKNSLEIKIKWAIPRGQDLLVADGRGLDHGMEPQRILHADGREYWRIPGSTFRGLFRSWMTKLAAREGYLVADSNLRQEKWRAAGKPQDINRINGENFGRCFTPPDRWDNPASLPELNCPIVQLFGSLFGSGRIHFSDALTPIDTSGLEEQVRMHVAVDRITGAAAESMLFENTVLVPSATSPSDPSTGIFPLHIRIDNPQDYEAKWLAKTISAIDLGLLRVGSSKSAGRLQLQCPPVALGVGSEIINSVKPSRIERS